MAMTSVEERLSRLEGVYDHLSSKADIAKVETQIADLRTELKGDIAGLRMDLKGESSDLRTELKGDIAGLRAEMHRGNASLIRWGVGFMVVGLGAMTAIVGYLG